MAKKGGKVGKVMHEYKAGTLKSSSGKAVTSKDQAIAIGLSEARATGEDVAPEPEPKKTVRANVKRGKRRFKRPPKFHERE